MEYLLQIFSTFLLYSLVYCLLGKWLLLYGLLNLLRWFLFKKPWEIGMIIYSRIPRWEYHPHYRLLIMKRKVYPLPFRHKNILLPFYLVRYGTLLRTIYLHWCRNSLCLRHLLKSITMPIFWLLLSKHLQPHLFLCF